MATLLPILCLVLLTPPTPVETKFVQVAPAAGTALRRSPGQRRAVLLIHGLHPHPFSSTNVTHALFTSWQSKDSLLVKTLAQEADVFAFAYGQNVPVDQIAELPELADDVGQVRRLGYAEIVLVGFSAGGLVVREFVEDHPDAGITRVVQVSAPNGGSSWATLRAVRPSQEAFLQSLTKKGRQAVLQERRDRKIPDKVQFVCVVGTGAGNGDAVVSSRCQWPDDLQRQGIPAFTVGTVHVLTMYSREAVPLIAQLVRQEQPRWDAARVAALRKQLRED